MCTHYVHMLKCTISKREVQKGGWRILAQVGKGYWEDAKNMEDWMEGRGKAALHCHGSQVERVGEQVYLAILKGNRICAAKVWQLY